MGKRSQWGFHGIHMVKGEMLAICSVTPPTISTTKVSLQRHRDVQWLLTGLIVLARSIIRMSDTKTITGQQGIDTKHTQLLYFLVKWKNIFLKRLYFYEKFYQQA